MSNFLSNKVDGSTLAPAEWNQFQDVNNLISSVGLTPASDDVHQLAKAVANYSAVGNYYNDNGTGNNYILSPIDNFRAPTEYINGMVVRFITTNANTTATPIINVAGLGAKNIIKADGTNVAIGDIFGYTELVYNGVSFVANKENENQIITIANNSTNINTHIDIITNITLTKTLQSSGGWTAGNEGNLLITGSRQASSTYHIFRIQKTDRTYDYCAVLGVDNQTPSVSNLPTNYVKYKYIGSVLTNGSGNIIGFKQIKNYFNYLLPIWDAVNVSLPTGIGNLFTVSTPKGLNTVPLGNIMAQSNSGEFGILVQSGIQTPCSVSVFNMKPTLVGQDVYVSVSLNNFITNSSSQLRIASESQNGTYYVETHGYINLNL